MWRKRKDITTNARDTTHSHRHMHTVRDHHTKQCVGCEHVSVAALPNADPMHLNMDNWWLWCVMKCLFVVRYNVLAELMSRYNQKCSITMDENCISLCRSMCCCRRWPAQCNAFVCKPTVTLHVMKWSVCCVCCVNTKRWTSYNLPQRMPMSPHHKAKHNCFKRFRLWNRCQSKTSNWKNFS